MADQLTFPACVIPGCTNVVAAVREPCASCTRAFGPMLRHNPGSPPLTAEEISERDSYTHRAYAVQRQIGCGR
ncbi:hypothetical protein MSP7336_01823 [Mycobacterium shimoidei]|uniref:Uncharacterized protein n=1 Tax=Mycobacterium shimoidei TaxID=29313 RepID=A0A375YXG0_MYCSH|nr:hypothetical protein [Mycobacterium shimoidei]SRX93584.1 hypothetical protein MSP7336_01823 [Mycobacterium shimoidei]